MKNTFLFIFIFVCTMAEAQFTQFRYNNDKVWHREEMDRQKFSWGFYLGSNLTSFKVEPNEIGTNEYGMIYLRQENKLGFSVGVLGRMRISDHIDLKLEPGVHFSERKLYFGNIESQRDSVREVKSTYFDVPLLIKIHGNRWTNTRPYIQGGVGYTMNLQAEEDKKEDNSMGTFRMKQHNFNWQVEAGVEIYFKRFKMTPSVKGMFFLNNELVADNPETDPQWANSLKSLKTRAVVFSIKFE